MTTIMFACRKNAGRSQIAAAIATAKAAPDIRILSAGSEPASELHPEAVAILAEFGLQPTSQTPRKLHRADVAICDYVITMGCGEACPYVPGVHYEDWPVADPNGQDPDTVRRIALDIENRVTDLLHRITS